MTGGKRTCGDCTGCVEQDCGVCKFCMDMKKFGGKGRKKTVLCAEKTML